MAARKTRQPPTREADDGFGLPASSENRSGENTPKRRRRFWLALGLFTTWFVCLLVLALLTANPVTLNRRQILDADLVVEAQVKNIATGECRVISVRPDALLGEKIVVAGLSDLNIEPEKAYLFPLRRETGTGTYSVMPTPPPESQVLVYPASDEALLQLEQILKSQ